jgi:hypothetical protein
VTTAETDPYEARRAADDAHRATLRPLALTDLWITIARIDGRLEHDECTRCGCDETHGHIVNVSGPTGDGHLCRPCIESVGINGDALASLVEGLGSIDYAIIAADGHVAVEFMRMAGEALAGLARYRLAEGATAAITQAVVSCRSCKTPVQACSFSQNPSAGRGTCCDSCDHVQVTGASRRPEEWKRLAAQQIVDDRVASGELTRLSHGGLVETSTITRNQS